jgi:NADH-quinone oxidoreductase subunit I
MTGTVSNSILQYFRNVWQGIRSVAGSFMTALPYLMNVKSGDLKKEVTEQYPDPVSSRIADELPPRTRGLLSNDIDRCTGCRDCEVVCPVRCISVETETGMNPSKVWVSVFDIDFSRCVFCGLCVEACIPGSLTHTKHYEKSAETPSELVASFGRGRVTPEQRAKWARMREAKDGEGVRP